MSEDDPLFYHMRHRGRTHNQNHVRKPAPIAWDTVANIAAAAAMFPVTGRPPPGWWMVSARREDNKTSSAASLSPPPIAAVVPSRKSSSAALPSSAAVCLRCARSFISASLFAVPDQSCSRSGGGGEASPLRCSPASRESACPRYSASSESSMSSST